MDNKFFTKFILQDYHKFCMEYMEKFEYFLDLSDEYKMILSAKEADTIDMYSGKGRYNSIEELEKRYLFLIINCLTKYWHKNKQLTNVLCEELNRLIREKRVFVKDCKLKIDANSFIECYENYKKIKEKKEEIERISFGKGWNIGGK